MCYCDFDSPSAYREVLRVARKPHTCHQCYRPIQPGDLYQVASGVWDGRGDSFNMCDTCKTVANLAEGLHDGPFCFLLDGGLEEALSECFPELFTTNEEEDAAA